MHVGVFGAGLIGSFVGLGLSEANVRVTLLGRQSLVDRRDSLLAKTLEGRELRPAPDLEVSTDPAALADVDVCLVAVKSSDTPQAARTLDEVLSDNAAVVSLQNGLHNAESLRKLIANRPVAAGVVTFNAYRDEEGTVCQATRGPLYTGTLPGSAGEHLEAMQAACAQVGIEHSLRSDIVRVMTGKLLLNLNNGICAATGLSIVDSVRDRDARWAFARSLAEGVRVMRSAGMHPRSPIELPLRMIPALLRLPTSVLELTAGRILAVDPNARSSTLQDLERGRRTEIDELNGEIVTLARRIGVPAPVNGEICDIVHAHEGRVTAGQRAQFVAPAELKARIKAR